MLSARHLHRLFFAFANAINSIVANRYGRVRWNNRQINLNEGRRLEAICRSDTNPSTLRLEVTRSNGRQREAIPLGLSFNNGYLSLSAVTQQDNGLEFTCSSRDSSDMLTLYVESASNAFAALICCLLCLPCIDWNDCFAGTKHQSNFFSRKWSRSFTRVR